MGLTAALIGVGVLGGAVANKALAPKVNIPAAAPAAPTPPPAATAPPPSGDTGAGAAAATMQKRKVAQAVGRGDTILTGPKGLGEIGTANTLYKTLLGQ